MIVTRMALPRRTILRGLGATLALPLLDSMVPALTATAQTPAKAPLRFGVVYVPNGMVMQEWTPAQEGAEFAFPAAIKPLEPFRDRITVLSGLANNPPPAAATGAGVHARASTRFLTNIPPKRSDTSAVEAGVSVDQLIAQTLGDQTQLASLEVAIEGRDLAGSCDIGFSCAYTNTIAWRGPSTPLPMENDPRVVFERMFGGSGSTDRAARAAQIATDRSILDSVRDRISNLQGRIGTRDKAKLGEYLEAVRDIERRIRKAEAQSDRELPLVERPRGVPAGFEEHAKLMFDLQLLAYETDLTRVITFMLGRELSGRTFTELGVAESHHATSHHQENKGKIANLLKIKVHHAALFAYYLDRLRTTPDGDGTLLDNVMIFYGAGMGDSNQHAPGNIPVMIAGGAGGRITAGRHVKYKPGTPMGNLHLRTLDIFGVHTEQFGGDSTGPIEQLTV